MQIQIEIQKIARSPPRTGRELQRYNLHHRQVVCCRPYRFTENKGSSSIVDELDVLLISSEKCEKMMFPKVLVNQAYVIGTSTKVDISGVSVEKFGDKYFAKKVENKSKKGEGEFFEAEKKVCNIHPPPPSPFSKEGKLLILKRAKALSA